MKTLLFTFLHWTGVTRVCAWWFRKRVIFLCYHGVTGRPTRSSEDHKGLHVNARRFARHLDFLQRRYHVISLREFIKAQREHRLLPQYSLVLTFGDGFRNFLTVAAPMLVVRRMPATVFLITDHAQRKAEEDLPESWSPADDQRSLSWAEARQLSENQLIDFGSHTCSHPGLLSLSPAESAHELEHSFSELITNLPTDSPALSYPKGQYSERLADDARKVGYVCAVTTDRGANEMDHDLFTLGRSLIGDYDDAAAFAVRVSGLRWLLVRTLGLFTRSTARASTQQSPTREPYPGKVYEISN